MEVAAPAGYHGHDLKLAVVGTDAVGIVDVRAGCSEGTLIEIMEIRKWLDQAVGVRAAEFDARLVEEGIPVGERLNRLVGELVKEPFWGALCRRSEMPFKGVAGVLVAGERWYSQHYGKQAVGQVGPLGSVPVMIAGAVAGVRIPMVFGTPPRLPLHVDGVSKEVLERLSDPDRERVQDAFSAGLRGLMAAEMVAFRGRRWEGEEWFKMHGIAVRNYRQAADAVLDLRFNDGAFWSQQSVEKALKAVAAARSGEFKRGHDLSKLYVAAVDGGANLDIAPEELEAVNPSYSPWGRDEPQGGARRRRSWRTRRRRVLDTHHSVPWSSRLWLGSTVHREGGHARAQAVTSTARRMSGKAPSRSLHSAALAVVIR